MSTETSKSERLVSSIYDAAVDGRLWDDALLTLADVTGCAMTALQFYDPLSGYRTGYAPLCAPDYAKSYRDYWRHHFSHWRSTDGFRVGQMLRSIDVMDVSAVYRGAFYNEWMRPQGIGGHSRLSNIVADNRVTAILVATKPIKVPKFRPDEQRLFETAIPHFIRALAIDRRLRVADAQQSAVMSGMAPAGFLIVDRQGRILAAHGPTHLRLCSAGLIVSAREAGRFEAPNPAVERLIYGAAAGRGSESVRAGQVDHRGPGGELLRITIIPLSAGAVGDEAWFKMDQPAALLCVSAPEDAARERVSRLAAEHGLTPAEAAVAIEAAKGDGRAAVAIRLGIRETTVRSHLSAIFDKLGIHRQAELARLVSNA